jgi:3',5'-cyclic-AMP phosphodiesterase
MRRKYRRLGFAKLSFDRLNRFGKISARLTVLNGTDRGKNRHLRMDNLKLSRRDFISRTAMFTGGLLTGLRVADAKAAAPSPAGPLRFVFATDSHLMVADRLRSEEGIIAALGAIESITPKPEFILFGGDLTHESPQLDFPAAEQLLDRFLKIWKDHTGLQTYFTFGNHDLAGTQNASVDRTDPRFGKGLYRMRLSLEREYYSFRKAGWRFIVLDDVVPHPDGSYIGEFVQEQLTFLQTELATAPGTPTILVGHIPSVSVLPSLGEAGRTTDRVTAIETPASLVARNAAQMRDVLANTQANVKAIFAGHLHHLEQIQIDGVSYINGGAVCGNWWKGAQHGCPEGFLLVDLDSDGNVATNYRSYGWKAEA